MLFWSFWLRSRWRGAAAAAFVALSLSALAWVLWGTSVPSLRMLGDAGAPRAVLAGVSGATLPRSADVSSRSFAAAPMLLRSGLGSVRLALPLAWLLVLVFRRH